MHVTVCELPNEPQAFEHAWERLADHVHQRGSELVLLPEMPFSPWFPLTPRAGAHVIVVPRATFHSTVEKWVAGGSAAAVEARTTYPRYIEG